ncbi:MAG: GNAT family N-acetyltransferase [Verrucomicrobia bacterium]|nr:GNAT family N-acetyltransferase [Verrucomicrobiota bacterium]
MDISVRQLRESDLDEADRIFRLAFGTFIGLPNPSDFAGDADFVRSRWTTDPSASFGAYSDTRLLGSNFAANWGSVAIFGPLTVHPDFWNQGVAKKLLGRTLELFARWGAKHEALYTFSNSPKHLALYQYFGFWPRFLTAIMIKPVHAAASEITFSTYATISDAERGEMLRACREMTDSVYAGLDLSREIAAVWQQRLGDTVLLRGTYAVDALAICHCGSGSEAGKDSCYIKFAAAKSQSAFKSLLEACDSFAAEKNLSRLVAGANAAREGAYRQLIIHGYRPQMVGVAMQRYNDPGYNVPGNYIIDDWR